MCILHCVIMVHGSLTIEVMPGKSRCIGQEMDEEDMAVFSFGANIPGANEKQIALHRDKQILTVSIQDPEGTYILQNEKVPIGAPRPRDFKQSTIQKRGVYDLCFELQGGESAVRAYFYVDFKSRDSQGTLDAATNMLDRKDVPVVEQKLAQAEHTLEVIQQEIDYAKEQEMALKESGKSMSDQIQYFSLLSMAVLVITSLWQLLYLRSFFTSKKVL